MLLGKIPLDNETGGGTANLQEVGHVGADQLQIAGVKQVDIVRNETRT